MEVRRVLFRSLAFVGLGGLALEKAFESALLQAQQDKLEGLIYALLGAASTTPDGDLKIALDKIPDRRLREPMSGLQAELYNELGTMEIGRASCREGGCEEV